MSDGSTIEWLDRPGTKPATWNPIRAARKVLGQETQGAGGDTRTGWYCEHVHEGCRHCYAEIFNLRLGNMLEYKPGNRDQLSIFLDEKTLLQPLRWKHPRTIFVCSMTDLYGPWVKDEWLDKIKAVQALTPQHTYIELTKRPERMRDYASNPDRECIVAGKTWSLLGTPKGSKIKHDGNWRKTFPLKNVWGLVSCSTQEDADKFIPILLGTPLAIRGVSAEPLLGPIDFENLPSVSGIGRYLDVLRAVPFSDLPTKLDWVIIGGESGRNARPMHPDWARAIVAQCDASGVACFFKQWGGWSDTHPDWPKAHSYAVANDGTVYEPSDIAFPDGARRAEALRAGHDRAHLTSMYRVGKKAGGRLLDGAEHNGFPQARTTWA